MGSWHRKKGEREWVEETNPEGMLLSRGAQALKSYLQDVSPVASVMNPLSPLPKVSNRQLYLLLGY